jgi:hypothetical protein
MTVSELIENLKDLPQDMEVMMDLTNYSEGNEATMFKFHRIEFVGDIKDSTGDIRDQKIKSEDVEPLSGYVAHKAWWWKYIPSGIRRNTDNW